MKKRLFDVNKLKTPINFANEKGVSKQRIYLLMQQGKIGFIEIDGTKFVIMNDKTINYRKT